MSALRNCNRICLWPALSLALSIGLAVGCKDVPPQNNTTALNSGSNTTGSQTPGAVEKGASDEPPQPAAGGTGQVVPKEPIALSAPKADEIYEPKVVLSQSHEETCLVKVGETLPNLALTGLAGESVSLNELRGDKLTVVVFWTNRLAFGREQFQRLAPEVAAPFRHLGVKVVAVNVGDSAEQIELDPATKDEVTCVLDPDGSAIAQVATGKLPRTYLIDGEGHILWFDLEYSRTMRRQLKNAIFYFSQDGASGAS